MTRLLFCRQSLVVELMYRSILIQEDDFIFGDLYESFRVKCSAKTGGLVAFVGFVRDMNSIDGESDQVESLELEHYPGMTEKSIAKIIDRASSSWSLEGMLVIHRVGKLKPEDQIVLVMAAASHRSEAFQAASMVMDFLKTEAEFWKKETGDLGTRWVQSTDQDLKRRESWEYNSE